MRSNKVEYSTATGPYCTPNYDKLKFCMQEFSSKNIIQQHFHVNRNKGELVIGYDMIIGRDLMEKWGLSAYFRRQVIQFDGLTVTMK